MKRLLLLRHAKAVAKDAARDFERVLADRGRSDMKLMAAVLKDPALKPDLALVSPSARTRETWELTGLKGVEARFEPAIYEGVPKALLGLIRAAPDAARSVMLVGHNPGFEELAQALSGGSGRAANEAALTAGLPTAALVVLDFDVEKWNEVASGRGRLERLVTPRSLGGGGRA